MHLLRPARGKPKCRSHSNQGAFGRDVLFDGWTGRTLARRMPVSRSAGFQAAGPPTSCRPKSARRLDRANVSTKDAGVPKRRLPGGRSAGILPASPPRRPASSCAAQFAYLARRLEAGGPAGRDAGAPRRCTRPIPPIHDRLTVFSPSSPIMGTAPVRARSVPTRSANDQ
jgi:hypothetical protein